MDIQNLILQGVLSISVLALFSAIFLYLKLKHTFEKRHQSIYQDLELLKQDSKSLSSTFIGLGQKLSRLEQDLERLGSRQDKSELRNPELASYAHAAKLVEMGSSFEELVEHCGLSRAEAELIFALHKKSTA